MIELVSRGPLIQYGFESQSKWRKILITVPLWIVNSRSIGVTRTSM